ncbi:MAG: NCS2 family permease [Candidatus Ornithospirochaeta sp.]|nr:NCS2 family permease [Candidatus Ornithospirochaeta sp.]
MEKLFKLQERKTTVKTEIIAGITTFLAMAYILAVNPKFLGAEGTGMDANAVFTATALASAIATLVMAFIANLPFALAPGMGLNAFFAYTVVLGMGYSFQTALTAVFIEGIIFIILTAFNIREAIVNSIPKALKNAISVGIGLFIAFIGLQGAGIIVGGATLVELVSFKSGSPQAMTAILALIGLIITSILLVYKVKGALLIGIIATAVIGIPMGVTEFSGFAKLPPSIAPTFCKFDFSEVFSLKFFVVMFTFLFVDMFDTLGTLIGCATQAKMLNEDGSIPNCKEALFADAVGTTVGAMLGTSTVTTFVESSTGVAEGGRTGLTALTVSVLFLLSLFFSPIFLAIPAAATAPALILVGFFMMSPVKEIDFSDPTEGIPAFLTMIMMITAYSISDGIMFGVISYTILKLVTKKTKDLSVITIILAVIFMLKFIIG